MVGTDTEQLVLYDRVGASARLTLNRPDARNAQNRAMLEALSACLRMAEQDAQVRVVILAGAGEHFSAGHDLKEAERDRSDLSVEARFAFEERHYLGYALDLWDFPKPVIAQVQGGCIAAGFMIANMCDLVVASDDAFFSDPVCRTLGAAAVEVLVHPWAMGLRRAKEMLYTGERVTAAEGLAMGMVNRVVPRAELEQATLALAESIARTPPFALRLIKRSLNRSLDVQGFRAALNAHFDTHQLSHAAGEFAQVRDAGLAAAIQHA